MSQSPNTELTRGAQTIRVIVRFSLRMTVLLAFAAFSRTGFDRILMLLLLMSATLSMVLATLKREEPLAPVINHWDEAAAYAALCCLFIAIGHFAPG